MKKILSLLLLVIVCISCKTLHFSGSNIVTSDIDNFWTAYDQVISTSDTLKQLELLEDLYLDKASPGLKKMIRARNYTGKEYLYTINSFPKFWSSVRQNTFKAKTLSKDLEMGLAKLKSLYPSLKPAKIYFTVGALRSNGTTMDNSVLIGSELAFATAKTVSDELPDYLSHLPNFFNSEPSKNIVFLNIHEYIHTQQKTTIGYNLLAQTVLEGVAEFIAEKALEKASPNPQIQFGRENDARIKAKFEREMFSPSVYNWIWNSPENEFGMRDLAYYVGYKICESYYLTSSNKQNAISEMIELDYNDEEELIAFVEKSNYFDKPLDNYKKLFEENRPIVKSIDPITNKEVDVNTNIITIHFSQEMETQARNFKVGPLGEKHLIRFKEFLGFAEDGKSIRFEIEPLEPNKKYQIVVGEGFKNVEGLALDPYLIEFKTTEK